MKMRNSFQILKCARTFAVKNFPCFSVRPMWLFNTRGLWLALRLALGWALALGCALGFAPGFHETMVGAVCQNMLFFQNINAMPPPQAANNLSCSPGVGTATQGGRP